MPTKATIVYTDKITGLIPNTFLPASTGGVLTGDVTGTTGANAVVRIQGTPVAMTVPTTGQALIYNGITYTPTTITATSTASNTTFTPTGDISAISVQAALVEIDIEKQNSIATLSTENTGILSLSQEGVLTNNAIHQNSTTLETWIKLNGLVTKTREVSGSGSGITNLSIGTLTATTIPLNSSSGTGVILPQATITTSGLLSAADKVTINNISSGASINVITPVAYANLTAQTTATTANQITQNINNGDVVIKDLASGVIQIIGNISTQGATLTTTSTLTATIRPTTHLITGTTIGITITLPLSSTQKHDLTFARNDYNPAFLASLTTQGADKIDNITTLPLNTGTSLKDTYILRPITTGYILI